MELLGMVPAHAVAIRIYSLPVAAATGSSLLCAWLVAAVATAVGLWRIRAAAGASKTGTGVRSGSSALVGEKQARAVAPLPLPPAAAHEPRPAAAARAEAAHPASPTVEPSTPFKVRFTAYYGGGGGGGSAHDDDGLVVVDGVRNCAGADEDGGCESEMVLRRRTASGPARRSTKSSAAATWEESEMAARWRGDLGWYRHLDMAALDGSVVRLWDGELTASPWGRGRRQVDWNFSCHRSGTAAGGHLCNTVM